jgi:hypothetical protein
MKERSDNKEIQYPEKTEGSEIAAQVRAKTNSLSEEEREHYLKIGMSVIYGGQPKTAGARH